MSDPNQEQRTTCKVCARPLKPPKTRFCSYVCQRRLQRIKQQRPSGLFFGSVRRPLWLDELAVAAGRDGEELRAKAQVDIEAGKLLGYERNGVLRAVGVPLREGELPEHVEARRELRRNAKAFWAQRRELNRSLKLQNRERRRRQRRNRAAREEQAA